MFRPQAGEVKVLVQGHGRIIFEQSFTSRDGKVDPFGPLLDATTRPVIIFPLTKDKEVVAIRQFRHGINDFILEVPGGNPKPGQTPEECLLHQLIRETGYQPKTVVFLGKPSSKGKAFDPASVRVRYITYLALGCHWVKDPSPERTEVIEVVKIPLRKWFEMVGEGEIEDSKTLALTALVQIYLFGVPKEALGEPETV